MTRHVRAAAAAPTEGLAAGRPLGFDVERIDRLARRHKEAVALDAAKTDIGTAFGQHDAADHGAVGGEDRDPVFGLAAAPGAPQIALDIDAEAVTTARLGGAKLAPVYRLGAVVGDIINLDRSLPWAWRVDDIEPRLVG